MGTYSSTLPYDIILLLYLFTVFLCLIQIIRIFCDVPVRNRAIANRSVPSEAEADPEVGEHRQRRRTKDWFDPILFAYTEMIVVSLIRACLVTRYRYPEYSQWGSRYLEPLLITTAHLITFWLSTTTTVHWASVCDPGIRDEFWLRDEREHKSIFVNFFSGIFNLVAFGLCGVYCISLIDDSIIPYPLYVGQLFYLAMAFLYLLNYILFVYYAAHLLPERRRNGCEYHVIHVMFALGFFAYLFYTAEKVSWLLALVPLDLGGVMSQALPSDVSSVLAYQYLALCFHLAGGFLIWTILNRGVKVGGVALVAVEGEGAERDGLGAKAREGQLPEPNVQEFGNHEGMNGYHNGIEMGRIEDYGRQEHKDGLNGVVQAAMFTTPLKHGEVERDSPIKGNRKDTVGSDLSGEVLIHTPARDAFVRSDPIIKNDRKSLKSPVRKVSPENKRKGEDDDEDFPPPPPADNDEMKHNRKGFEKQRASLLASGHENSNKLKSPESGSKTLGPSRSTSPSDAELQPGLLPSLPGVPSASSQYLPAVTPVKPKATLKKPAFVVPESPDLPPPPPMLSPPESPVDIQPKDIRRTQPLPSSDEFATLRRGSTPQPPITSQIRAPTPAKSQTATAPVTVPTVLQQQTSSSSSSSQQYPSPQQHLPTKVSSPLLSHHPQATHIQIQPSRPVSRGEEKRTSEIKQFDHYSTPQSNTLGAFRRPVYASDSSRPVYSSETTTHSGVGVGGGGGGGASRGRNGSVASSATFRDDDGDTRSVVDSEVDTPGILGGGHEESPESLDELTDGRLSFPQRTNIGRTRDVVVHDDAPEWDLYPEPVQDSPAGTPPFSSISHSNPFSSSSASNPGNIRNSSRGLQLPPLPTPPIEHTEMALDFHPNTNHLGHSLISRVNVVGDAEDYPDDEDPLDDFGDR